MPEILGATDASAEAGLMAAIRTEREGQTAPPEEKAPESAPEAPVAASEAPEPTEAPEDTPSEPEAPQEAPESPEEEALELSRMAELVEYVGADEASMYDLTIPVTVDGKPVEIPLGELKDAYRGVTEATRMQEEAKAFREQAATDAQHQRAQYESQLAQGAELLKALESQAMERFRGVNWEELRANDPSEWSAKRMEAQAVHAQLQQTKNQVEHNLSAYKLQMEAQQAAALEEHVRKEQAALHTAWPELADPEKGKDERSALIEELRTRGFQDEEIGNAADHRLLLMARDAMRYRQSAKQADTARKKVVKIQKKVLTPGAAKAKAERGGDAINKAAAKLKKSGDHRDFANWLGEVRRRS